MHEFYIGSEFPAYFIDYKLLSGFSHYIRTSPVHPCRKSPLLHLLIVK